MRIDELDEYQGLEAQMVRDWLTSKGCYRQDGPWRHPTAKYSYTDGEYGGLLWEDTLFKLSVDFELASVQALLREINPRMRKGWPNTGALSAHKYWLAKPFGDDAFCVVWTTAEIIDKQERAGDVDIGFWPCDANGNKVRWPTDANGAML